MPDISEDQVQQALRTVKYPGFSRDIVSFGLVRQVTVTGRDVAVVIEHTIAEPASVEQIRAAAEAALRALPGVGRVGLELRRKEQAPQKSPDPLSGRQMLPGIRHCVAVASAKGGVGKSTVATNLALALARKGLKVGLMDADIYGPSLPTMMGIDEQPTITAERKIIPIDKHGVRNMSIGFLVPQEKAMIWRGPMVMAAVSQFLGDVLWGELDILVVDLPPGTGDAQLTLVQKVPLSGVVMVTTPQDVALIDVVRGIQMFEETRAPIIGVVENMSGFVCSHCGNETEIFGKGGGKRTSDRYGVPFLGAVPIETVVRECGDAGRPVVVAHPASASARAFAEVADSVERFLKAKDDGATPR
jgi:ATP-binding protein involved in chromosome partitioning